jgi:hypothetical protein
VESVPFIDCDFFCDSDLCNQGDGRKDDLKAVVAVSMLTQSTPNKNQKKTDDVLRAETKTTARPVSTTKRKKKIAAASNEVVHAELADGSSVMWPLLWLIGMAQMYSLWVTK